MRSLLRAVGTVLVLGTLHPATAVAQGDERPHDREPQIIVSATEEVEVPADRAHLTVAVETRGRTSQAAASENARIQSAVIDGIRRLGIPAAQLRTQAVTVTPEYEYPKEGGRPTVVGYQARNVLAVELHELARIGQVIDAALSGGATSISGPRFALSAPDSARRVALGRAVAKARADAEVMAAASDVVLGRVLELTSSENASSPMYDMPRVAMLRSEAATETPVEVGTITVRASVTLRVAVTSRR